MLFEILLNPLYPHPPFLGSESRIYYADESTQTKTDQIRDP